MSIQQGADERRIAQLLRQRGVGPDATAHPNTPAPPAGSRLPDWWLPKPHISPDHVVEPAPPQRPRDWLDDIIDSPPAPDPTPEPEEPAAEPAPEAKPKAPKQPKKKPGKAKKSKAPAPRQSLLDAYASIPPRLRWLAYHATAAGAGWWLGWVDWATDTAAWYAADNWTTTSAWVLYGLGLCACGLYRRSRRWAWPFAWAAAVPVSSIVVGVLLYAPNS